MARAVRRKVVALDNTGEALTNRGAGHVDHLTDLEELDTDARAWLEIRGLRLADPELLQDRAAFDTSFGVVARPSAC